jgi:hypothetical protein
MIALPQKAKGERPVYLQDRTTDNILAIVLALAGEMVVMRERLDTAERLLGDAGLKERIDSYRPTSAVLAEREAWRAQFIDIVMRPIQQEYEGLEETAEPKSYASAIEAVSAAD